LVLPLLPLLGGQDCNRLLLITLWLLVVEQALPVMPLWAVVVVLEVCYQALV
jgi:hypothetical protein